MSPLEKAQQRMQALRDSGELERLDPIEKARRNPASLRLAINAKCCECMGGPNEPGFRRHITDCTSPQCPIFTVRPYQNPRS